MPSRKLPTRLGLPCPYPSEAAHECQPPHTKAREVTTDSSLKDTVAAVRAVEKLGWLRLAGLGAHTKHNSKAQCKGQPIRDMAN